MHARTRMRTCARMVGGAKVRKKRGLAVAFSDRGFCCPVTGRSCVLGVSVRIKPSATAQNPSLYSPCPEPDAEDKDEGQERGDGA